MVAAISRAVFVSRLATGVHLDRMSPELKSALEEAGVTPQHLREIAGKDLVIRGDAELTQLFRKLDQRAEGIKIEGQVTVGGRAFLLLELAAKEPSDLRVDGRLDVAIAIGAGGPERSVHLDAEREVMSGLRARGFTPLGLAKIRAMPGEDRARLGLEDKHLDPSALHFVRDEGEGKQTVVRLSTGGTRALDHSAMVIRAGGTSSRNPEQPATGLRPQLGARDPQKVIEAPAGGSPVLQILDSAMRRGAS